MSRVVADAGELDWVARQVGQAGVELEDTARQVAALASWLPPPVAGPYSEASWAIRRGLEAEAQALDRLAAEVRLVGRAVELAEAGGFDPRLASMGALQLARAVLDRDGWRRRGGPPPAPQGAEPADEELLRALRVRLGWQIAASPGGLLRLQLSQYASAAAGRRSSSAMGLAAAAAIILGLLFAAGSLVDNPATDTRPTPAPTRTGRDAECDPEPPGQSVDRAKHVLLDQRHIDAVRRELKGEVVHTKPDGTPSDHVTEYRQEQDRVRKRIADLRRIISDSRCSAEDKTAAQRELADASRLLDWTEKNVLPKK
jgi:hypothetical protein